MATVAQLHAALAPLGVPTNRITEVADAGYFMHGVYNPSVPGSAATMVRDGLHGNKASCYFAPEEFAAWLLGEHRIDRVAETFPVVSVGSIDEAKAFVASLDTTMGFGQICFRGQLREYWVSRAVPNPRIALPEGERSILPTFWRDYLDRRIPIGSWPWNLPRDIFNTAVIDPLIFHGLGDWRSTLRKLAERHGNLNNVFRDDIVDELEKETFGRYERFHHAFQPGELFIARQHYGVPTIYLDLTLDLGTAGFFATHAFDVDGSRQARYTEVARGSHTGLIHCFRFPKIIDDVEEITRFKDLGHLEPERVLRQRCALRSFGWGAMNEAPRDLAAIIRLAPDFSTAHLPSREYIFPSPSEDPFFRELLKLKARYPSDLADIYELSWHR